MMMRQMCDDETDEISINFVWALQTEDVYLFQKINYMRWNCPQKTAFVAQFNKIDFHSTAWRKTSIWIIKRNKISISIDLIWALRTRNEYFYRKINYMKSHCSKKTDFVAQDSKICFHSTAWSKHLIWMNDRMNEEWIKNKKTSEWWIDEWMMSE